MMFPRKTECIHREGLWRSAEQVELATCSWADWFNHDRLHSALGYLTPTGYEAAFHARENPDPIEATNRTNTPHEHQLAGEPSLH